MIEKNISFNTLRTSNLAIFGNCSTGTGYLFKWDDGDKFYKSGELVYGEFNNHQPIVECLVSDIRNLLNISGVDYSLEVIHSEGNDFFEERDILCCVSTNFKKANEDYIPFARIYNNNNEILIDNILKDFPQFEEELNLMLILDFIVNNVDRHFNNFGIVKNNKNEEIRFSPII